MFATPEPAAAEDVALVDGAAAAEGPVLAEAVTPGAVIPDAAIPEVADLSVLAAKLGRLDERVAADDELMATVSGIEAARRFLDGAESALLGELDARGSTDVAHGMRTAGWLARESGCAPGTAKARVAVAARVRQFLPGTDAAVREGRLSFDRARVMSGAVNERIVTEFQAMEDDLIAESARMTFAEFSQRVRIIAELLDQDGPEPADDPNNNRLHLRGGPDGLRASGTFVGDLAVTTRQAIDQVADELFRQYRDDAKQTDGEIDVPSRPTLQAMAFAELCRRGLMVNAEGKGTAPKVEATLVIHADTPDIVYLNGKPLVRGSATALACDMSVYAIILDSLGVPLDMGREIRSANREQKRALKCRDGGCVFPGCGRPPEHCDAHHVAWWWRDLGTTSVRRMVYLCRHHHGVVHRKGWGIQIGDDGWAWITTPSGISLWCQRHGVQRAGPAPPHLPIAA